MNRKKIILILNFGYEITKALSIFVFVTLGVFLFIHWMPGSEADSWYIDSSNINHENQLIFIKYINWLYKAIQLDFGFSLRKSSYVIDGIYHSFPVTIYLLVGASLVSIILSLAIGILWATSESNFFVRSLCLTSNIFSSIPIYLLGMGAITGVYFYLKSQHIHPDYMGIWRLGNIQEQKFLLSFVMFLIPPTLLGVGNGNLIELSVVIKDSIKKILNTEFIKAVRARGASVTKHVAQNLLLDLISLIDARITYLISGAVIIENVFIWNGLGWLGVEAAKENDYPVIMALVLLYSCIIIFVRICKISLFYLIDPRMRANSNVTV